MLQLWEKNGVFSPEIINNLLHMEVGSSAVQTSSNTFGTEVSAVIVGAFTSFVLFVVQIHAFVGFSLCCPILFQSHPIFTLELIN